MSEVTPIRVPRRNVSSPNIHRMFNVEVFYETAGWRTVAGFDCEDDAARVAATLRDDASGRVLDVAVRAASDE